MNVNLGIGIPTLLPLVLPSNIKINLQSENGIMGVGPYPTVEQASGKNINAGKVILKLFSKLLLCFQGVPTSRPLSLFL